jgi:aromatic ring-opening dioxygenase catalytic subunit (LigB family)
MDLIFENIVSVYISTGRSLYQICQSLLLNHWDNVGFSTDITPDCVVTFKVHWEVLRQMLKFLARVAASMPFHHSATHTLAMCMEDLISVKSVWSHNVIDILRNL